MKEDNADTSLIVPNAVLDTNVVLAIYSWHDVTDTARIVLERDPSASLEHSEIQFRAQRARAAFLLTLFFNERGWATASALNEVRRTLNTKAPPTDRTRAIEINYRKLYVYFIREKLLPCWKARGDLEADAEKKSNDVDRLYLDWAESHKVPLISWEGSGPSGAIPSKLIPTESAKRGIDLVTPEQLLEREKFDDGPAAERFLAAWDEHAPRYLSEDPGARETLEFAHYFFLRMARNDWTP